MRKFKLLRKIFPDPEKYLDLLVLRYKIEKYVKENVVDLIKQLENMALTHENASQRKALNPACTFVLVAGQASQFKPIRRAIEKALARLSIPKRHQCFLPNDLAKEACCVGAVAFQRTRHKHINPKELFGTYGLLAEKPTEMENYFLPFDMSRIRIGGEDSKEFGKESEYCLVYSPLDERQLSNGKQPPRKNDGYTAVILSKVGQNFTIAYDPDIPEIRLDGESVSILGTYGNISYQSIYPRVWPEVLEPINGER